MSTLLALSTLEDNFNYSNEVNKGFGYSSLFNKPMNLLCSGTDYYPGESLSQNVHMNMQVVESISEYEKVQSFSFKASGSYGPFGGGASGSFINTLNINSYSCYLIVSVSVINPIKFLSKILLLDNAKKTLQDEKLFVERYGDSYVNGLIKGGELFIAYEFKSSTKLEKKTIASKLKASAKMFNAKASAEYKESVKQLNTLEKEQIVFYSSAFKVGSSIPKLTLEELLQYSLDFPMNIDNNSNNSVLGFEIKSISKIENLIDYPDYITSKELFDQIQKKNFFEDTVENFYDWQRDISYVRQNPEQFSDDAIKQAENDFSIANERILRLKGLLDELHFTEDYSPLVHVEKVDFQCNPNFYERKPAPKTPAPTVIYRKRRPRFVLRTPVLSLSF